MLIEGTPPWLLGLILTISPTLAEVCYNQQGFQDPGLFPCNADGGCCRAGDYCWSNGFCGPGAPTIGTGGGYYFFGCTDANWTLSGCISQCLNTTTGNGMKSCPGGVQDGTSPYCCLGYSTDCDCAASNVVRVPTGTIVTSLSRGYTTPASSSTSSSSVSQSTDPSTTADTAASSSAASGTDDAEHSSSGLSTGAKIGIGVGVGVGGALIIGALAAFIVRRRRARSAAHGGAELDHYTAEKKHPHEMGGVQHRGHEMHSNTINWKTTRGPVEAPS